LQAAEAVAAAPQPPPPAPQQKQHQVPPHIPSSISIPILSWGWLHL
ncbi:hypothetical protein A2U01_0086033, partial [Trifolium medium]|nr:hypothetical protein [Trifolium medium]